MDEQLLKLLKNSYPKGVIKGNEFLLPPDDALRLIDVIEQAGIPILGVTCWYYGGPEGQLLGEDLNIELSINADILTSKNAVSESARLTRVFLKTELLDYHTFVEIWLTKPTQTQKASLITNLSNSQFNT